ncbi:MAG: hypothetical protein LBI69_03350 [Puniceicoccales bacterium]|jgi:hypothetical protein|nr:hypothetical protein [Puniceicoccales bacterium]
MNVLGKMNGDHSVPPREGPRVEDMDTGEIIHGSSRSSEEFNFDDLGPYRNCNSPADNRSKIFILAWLGSCGELRNPIKKWLEGAERDGLSLQQAEEIVRGNAEREILNIQGQNAERARCIVDPQARKFIHPKNLYEENLIHTYDGIDEINASILKIRAQIATQEFGEMPKNPCFDTEMNGGKGSMERERRIIPSLAKKPKKKNEPPELSEEEKLRRVLPEFRPELIEIFKQQKIVAVERKKADAELVKAKQQAVITRQKTGAEVAEMYRKADAEMAEIQRKADAETMEKQRQADAEVAEIIRSTQEMKRQAEIDATEMRRQAAEKSFLGRFFRK